MRHRFVEDTPNASEVRPPCQKGCRLHRQHTPECTDPCVEACIRRCRSHCTGCVPRPSAPNLKVCGGCNGRVRRALAELPTLVAWISTHEMPSSGTSDDPHVTGSRTPPAPVRLDAIDDADELHAVLILWCQTVVHLHPGDLAGPVLNSTHGGTRSMLSVNPRALADTVTAATWLTTWLPWALDQDFAAELVLDIAPAVETAKHRWPIAEDPTRLPLPCPACQRNSLVRLPPSNAYAPVTIACDYDDCRETIPESHYQWHERMLTEERKAGRRPVAEAG